MAKTGGKFAAELVEAYGLPFAKLKLEAYRGVPVVSVFQPSLPDEAQLQSLP